MFQPGVHILLDHAKNFRVKLWKPLNFTEARSSENFLRENVEASRILWKLFGCSFFFFSFFPFFFSPRIFLPVKSGVIRVYGNGVTRIRRNWNHERYDEWWKLRNLRKLLLRTRETDWLDEKRKIKKSHHFLWKGSQNCGSTSPIFLWKGVKFLWKHRRMCTPGAKKLNI